MIGLLDLIVVALVVVYAFWPHSRESKPVYFHEAYERPYRPRRRTPPKPRVIREAEQILREVGR